MNKKIKENFLNKFKNRYFSFLICLFFLIGFLFCSAALAEPPAATPIPPPSLKVAIPKFGGFSADVGDGNPWLGQYIVSVYNYAIGISGLLAAVVLMYGGFLWVMAGGNPSKINEAKDYIGGAILGLVLVMTSYTILSAVNPDILQPGKMNIQSFQKEIDVSSTKIDINANTTLPSGVDDNTSGCCLVGSGMSAVCKSPITMKQCKELSVGSDPSATKSFRATAACDYGVNFCVTSNVKENQSCSETDRCDVGLACYNNKCIKEEKVVCLTSTHYSPCKTVGIAKGYCYVVGDVKECYSCKAANQKCSDSKSCETICCSGLFEYLPSENYNICK